MPSRALPDDPLWPRASAWLRAADDAVGADIALLGVPAHKSSITPTGAHMTPTAVREALARYSTWAASTDVDVASLRAVDLGDVDDPDGPGGDARIAGAVGRASGSRLLVAVGGDNSITRPLMAALADDDLPEWGLVTVDAHHDLRDGESNGSPVRQLLDAGLPGARVVQVGIADFSNSPSYAERAGNHGITVIRRRDLRGADISVVIARALDIAGVDGRPVFVDIDVDVCDRSVVPGCPSSAPGGLSADELRQMAFAFGSDSRVRAIDITEIDATADAPDGRTVRLAALLVLEAAAGVCNRRV